MDTKSNMLRFRIQEVRLCLDLADIKKIFLLPRLQKVPNSAIYVAGLINIAGMSVPVIDLALRLKLERTQPYNLETSIVLCQTEKQEMGLIVDQIIDIKPIEKNA